VAGSSSDIGEASVLLFAKLSAKVVVTGRNQQKISRVAQKCEQISEWVFKYGGLLKSNCKKLKVSSYINRTNNNSNFQEITHNSIVELMNSFQLVSVFTKNKKMYSIHVGSCSRIISIPVKRLVNEILIRTLVLIGFHSLNVLILYPQKTIQ
jgi:hypothetical protein